jgi:hypothetical protein
MSLRNTLSPTLPGGRAESYEHCLLFTYRLVLVIGNYTDVFRVFFSGGGSGGEGYVGEFFMEEFFIGEGNFP